MLARAGGNAGAGWPTRFQVLRVEGSRRPAYTGASMRSSAPAGVGAFSLLAELAAPFQLAAGLLVRHWPQLLLTATLGMLAHDLLLLAAVETGLANPLAGMVVLSLVVLAKLVATVIMLMLLRPDLPAVRSLRRSVEGEASAPETGDLLPLVAVAILPFFAYYAAWGFLGDTVREYSRLGLAKAPLGEGGDFLNVLRSSWLLASIAVCWAIRWAVKQARQRSKAAIWPLLIVACDATWIFIGLYGISVWQDEVMRWIGSGDFLRALPDLKGVDAMLSMQAWAAGDFVPVELRGPGFTEEARRLFFFTLLPLVWLVMTAIVYGYDLSPQKKDEDSVGRRAGMLKWLVDFIAHFIDGYRQRAGGPLGSDGVEGRAAGADRARRGLSPDKLYRRMGLDGNIWARP